MSVHALRARSPLRLCLAVAAAVGLGGCGPDLGTPEGTTRAFVEAMAQRDWDAACALLSHDLVHRSTGGDSRYCAHYLERWHPDTSRYETLEVRGEAVGTADGHRLEVAPEGAPGETEEVVVVEESGRLVLARYPGSDTAFR